MSAKAPPCVFAPWLAPFVCACLLQAPAGSLNAQQDGLRVIQHPDDVLSFSFSPDSKVIATSGDGKIIRLWDATSGKEISSLPPNKKVSGVMFVPKGKYLLVCDEEQLDFFAYPSLKKQESFKGGNLLGISRDGKTFFSEGPSFNVLAWDLETKKKMQIFKGHTAQIGRADCTPDGKTLVTSSFDKTIRLWNISDGKELLVINKSIAGISLSPDGRKIACSGTTRLSRVEVLELKSGKKIWSKPFERTIFSVVYIKKGRVVAASTELAIFLLDAETGEVIKKINVPTDFWVMGLQLSPDEQMLAAVSPDNNLWIWDVSKLPEPAIKAP